MLDALLTILKILAPFATTGAGILLARLRNKRSDPTANKLAQAVANGTAKQIQLLLREIRRQKKEINSKDAQIEMLKVKNETQAGIKEELEGQIRRYERMLKRRRDATGDLVLGNGNGNEGEEKDK
jgi:uncharacterized protein YydD (DUF2326 family)